MRGAPRTWLVVRTEFGRSEISCGAG